MLVICEKNLQVIWKYLLLLTKIQIMSYSPIAYVLCFSIGIALIPNQADASHIRRPIYPQFRNISNPVGAYNYGVAMNNFYFLAGQSGRHPVTGQIQGDIETQTRQALRNIGTVLSALNLNFTHVLRSTLYLKQMRDVQTVDRVYREFFQVPYPARVTIGVAELPLEDSLIEIETIAYISSVGMVNLASYSIILIGLFNIKFNVY